MYTLEEVVATIYISVDKDLSIIRGSVRNKGKLSKWNSSLLVISFIGKFSRNWDVAGYLCDRDIRNSRGISRVERFPQRFPTFLVFQDYDRSLILSRIS